MGDDCLCPLVFDSCVHHLLNFHFRLNCWEFDFEKPDIENLHLPYEKDIHRIGELELESLVLGSQNCFLRRFAEIFAGDMWMSEHYFDDVAYSSDLKKSEKTMKPVQIYTC